MLNEPYREVLRLRYLEDLTTAEIAVRLGRREGTVRVQLKRGLDILRARAGKDERRFAALWLAWLRGREPSWRSAIAFGAVAILAAFVATEVDSRRSGTRPTATVAGTSDAPPVAAVLEEPMLHASGRTHAAAPLPPSTSLPLASIELEVGSLVQGDCLTDLGEAVPGTEIWGAPHARLGEGELLGRADGDGHYRVRVPPGIDWLWADEVLLADDGTEKQRTGSLRVRLAASPGAVPVDLCFTEGLSTSLSGSVMDSTGLPVEGARVSMGARWRDAPLVDRWQIHPHPSSAVTDARGEFILRLFRSTQQDLCVVKEGFAPASARVLLGASDVIVRLPRPSVLTGRLVAAGQRALARAELRLVPAEPLPELVARTDEVGRFQFDLVPPGDFLVRGFPLEAGLSLLQAGRCDEGEVRDLGDLLASETCSIVGRALEDGRPLEGWPVLLEEEARDIPRAARSRIVTTGADGSFEFKACRAQSHRAWLLEPGGLDGPARATRGDLRPGGMDVRLEAAPASARIHGRVEESFRANIQVVLEGELLPRQVIVPLGPDGSFERCLPAGAYAVVGVSRALGRWTFASLELAGGESRRLDCRPPETGSLSILIRPAPGFDRSVLRNLQGQIIGAAYSTTFHAGHAGSGAQIDVEQGTICLPSLLPGEYVALLYTGAAGGMGAEYRSARVEAGRKTELEVQFEPGHAVRVQCRSQRLLQDGELFSCVIESKHGEVRFPVGSDLPGSLDAMLLFRKLLAVGSYALRLESDGGLVGSLRFSVPCRESYELQLR